MKEKQMPVIEASLKDSGMILKMYLLDVEGAADNAGVGTARDALTLVQEQTLADVPTQVLFPDQVLFRHHHVGEEHLVER